MNQTSNEDPPEGFDNHFPDYSEDDIRAWSESHYAEQVSNPVEWFERSRALIATARITRKQADKLISRTEQDALHKVCSMLYGLSLENLFKAHWFLNKHGAPHLATWEPEATFPKEVKTHNLVKLARMINLELTDKRRHILEYLTESATWSGRYPCSLSSDDLGTSLLPGTFDVAEKIYRKLKKNFTLSD
nr:hypothetical protein [uncultured Pseudomonas sp.]